MATLAPTVAELRTYVRRALGGGIALLVLLHLVFTWPAAGTFSPVLVDLVHLDREHNLPTWFSSAQLFVLALAFFAVAYRETRTRRRRVATAFWFLCGAVSLFLSLDETAQLHEAVGQLAGDTFRAAEVGSVTFYLSRFPSYYWALIYVPIAVPVGVVFAGFAIREMVGSRLLAIGGLLVYGLGAVVLDHLEGRYGNAAHDRMLFELAGQTFRFDIFLIEELLEMLGVLMVIEAVFRHLVRLERGPAVSASHPPAPTSAPGGSGPG